MKETRLILFLLLALTLIVILKSELFTLLVQTGLVSLSQCAPEDPSRVEILSSVHAILGQMQADFSLTAAERSSLLDFAHKFVTTGQYQGDRVLGRPPRQIQVTEDPNMVNLDDIARSLSLDKFDEFDAVIRTVNKIMVETNFNQDVNRVKISSNILCDKLDYYLVIL